MPKIAVHMHLFYTQQLNDLLSRLQNMDGTPYDLYVTICEDNDETIKKIRQIKPQAKIWQVPNLGYDVGPFIDFLHHINLDNYDYILKIHTKRTHSINYCYFNKRRFDVRTWREMLLDAIISKPAISEALNLLAKDSKIGMLGSSFVLTNEKKALHNLEKDIEAEMRKIGLETPDDKHFIAGTMFWVRSKLLKPFLAYNIHNFEPSSANTHDETLAHVLERMFGIAITAQGYKIKGICYKKFLFNRFMVNFQRFIFQKKVTHRGKTLIKICKIPVYCRKENI